MSIFVKCNICGIDNILPGCACLNIKLLHLEDETTGIYVTNKDKFDCYVKLINEYNAQMCYYNIINYKHVFLYIDNIKITLINTLITVAYIDKSKELCVGDLILQTSCYDEVYRYLDDNGYRTQTLQLKFVD